MNADQLRAKLWREIQDYYESTREYARENKVNHAQLIAFMNGDDPDPAVLRAMDFEEVKHEKKYRRKQ